MSRAAVTELIFHRSLTALLGVHGPRGRLVDRQLTSGSEGRSYSSRCTGETSEAETGRDKLLEGEVPKHVDGQEESLQAGRE